jgi:hypothetical protein
MADTTATDTTAPNSFVAADLQTWLGDNAPVEWALACKGACTTRGARAGRIRKSLPPASDRAARGAWRALMYELAPTRAAVEGILIASDAERAAFHAVDRWLRDDRPARIVVRLGGGAPLEFHTDHTHVTADVVARFSRMVGIDADALGWDWLRR